MKSMRAADGSNARTSADLWLLAKHDFRTPAQALKMLAGAVEGARSEEDRRDLAMQMALLAGSLEAMIAGMTLVARLEAGEIGVGAEAIDLAGLSRMCSTDLGARVGPVGGRVVLRDVSCSFTGDSGLLEAIVRGMILYAMKEAGSGDIELHAVPLPSSVELSVSFAGRHSRSALTSLAFVELPPRDETSGHPVVGLGPALLARVASQLGGSLVLRDGADGRALVQLALPAPPHG